MEQNWEPRETRPVKKPSLGKKLLTVGCILLAALVIAVGVGAVYLNSLLGNVEREELNENDLGISSSAGESLPENEPQTGGTGELSSQDVTNIALFGVGGSTFTPFGTPSEFPEASFSEWLNACWQRARVYPHTILVSHNPPKDTACDVIPGDVHVGSTAVREFLEEAQPELCLCGHIHEARAIDRVGRTLVVNPGALAQGGYVVVRSNDGQLSAELCRLDPQED